MKKVVVFLICLLLFTKVYAYENKYFSIDIKEPFKGPTVEGKKYVFTNGNEYISIIVNKNKDNYEISKFTDEDIENQKKYLETEYKEKFSKYSSNVSITNIELKNIDSLYYLEYDVFYETKKTIGYNIYQRCRMYSTDNYIYSILYNSDKEITNNDYLDTFKIKDKYLKDVNITTYIISLISLLVLLLLIDYLFSKKKHKKRH